MTRRALAVLLILSVVVVVAHLFKHAVELRSPGEPASSAPYSVSVGRKTDRVVLFIVDSLPVRIAEDADYMPLLAARMKESASGVLWASQQTGTQQGILGLGTGMPTSAADYLSFFGAGGYAQWTIFEDIRDRGETLSFNGDRRWVSFFGSLGTYNHPTHGSEETFFAEDMAAIRSAEEALRLPVPPAFTVIHVTETDFVAHQFGTFDPRYREVMRRWDGVLDEFIKRTLDGWTTVIVTSDHGNDAWGSHGGGADIFRRVPVVMVGKGIRPAHGFIMNNVDMPATVAILLGVRLPGGAVAKPATAPLDLTVQEEATVLHATYDHLIAAAESKGEPDLSEHRRRSGELKGLAESGRFEAVVERIMEPVTNLLLRLEPRRSLRPSGIVWALGIFAMAVALLWTRPGVMRDRRALAAPIIGFILAEALLIVRFGFVAEIKAFLAAPSARGVLRGADLHGERPRGGGAKALARVPRGGGRGGPLCVLRDVRPHR